MFSLPQSPVDLLGAEVLFADGTPAAICAVYNLAAGVTDFDDFWVIDIQIPLGTRECHYRPELGVSLTGKRSFPLSVIGRECWLTTLP